MYEEYRIVKSYWFVVWEYEGKYYNDVIQLDGEHFLRNAAIKASEAKKCILNMRRASFIVMNFIRVSKETFDEFHANQC